jgi:hypothetical protein
MVERFRSGEQWSTFHSVLVIDWCDDWREIPKWGFRIWTDWLRFEWGGPRSATPVPLLPLPAEASHRRTVPPRYLLPPAVCQVFCFLLAVGFVFVCSRSTRWAQLDRSGDNTRKFFKLVTTGEEEESLPGRVVRRVARQRSVVPVRARMVWWPMRVTVRADRWRRKKQWIDWVPLCCS